MTAATEMEEILRQRIVNDLTACEKTLRGHFHPDPDLTELLESMQYSLFAGGKRIRPLLVIETCRMCGGEESNAYPFAAALEMIHTYSLIHDDLPCMDDDALRRGKPTNHCVFGESTALLAGDALLTDAFGVVASAPGLSGDIRAEAVRVLAEAAGSCGMVGGQIMDLRGETERLPLNGLLRLHSLKTGALIRAAVLLGALAAGIRPGEPCTQQLVVYAEKIGLAFQIRDDILDKTATESEIGKSVGVDAAHEKTTFLTYYSIAEAEQYVNDLTEEALSALNGFSRNRVLNELAVWLAGRKY